MKHVLLPTNEKQQIYNKVVAAYTETSKNSQNKLLYRVKS